MGPTEVCLTVDTEFSIHGALSHPGRKEPLGDAFVYGATDGKEHGLGFLLDCFARHGARATFFVEALNHIWFGDEPMGRVTRRILDAGHDAQLHTHPAWLHFRSPTWQADVSQRKPSDTLVGRSPAEVAECVSLAMGAFERWGAPRPVALRTGSLRADRALYDALPRAGIRLTSNLGVGYHRPGEAELDLRGGLHRVGDVVEVPVLTYSALGRDRILTVTGTGGREAEAVLRAARRAGVSPVVLLTHPFEFFTGEDDRCERVRPNRVNQARLDRLCAFLGRRADEFRVTTFAEAAPRWLGSAGTANPRLEAPWHAALLRIAANGWNDLFGR
jgi:peptidoglycan/xylan/chitin deacetylase (PgdA/CDA1 family)